MGTNHPCSAPATWPEAWDPLISFCSSDIGSEFKEVRNKTFGPYLLANDFRNIYNENTSTENDTSI